MITSKCLEQTTHIASEKFGFVSSQGLVEVLGNHGLELDKVVDLKIRSNKAEREGFQKHRMLFNTPHKTEQGVLQMLVTNSHEGSSALTFSLGYYRFICANGLVAGKTIFEPIRLRHTLANVEQLNDTISMALNQKTKIFESVEEMRAKKFNEDTFVKFAQDALEIRGYDKTKHGILVPDFKPKRYDDRKDDSFTVMNVVQENILRTGFKAFNDKGERVTMRAIKSLDEQNRINTQLWDLALSA